MLRDPPQVELAKTRVIIYITKVYVWLSYLLTAFAIVFGAVIGVAVVVSVGLLAWALLSWIRDEFHIRKWRKTTPSSLSVHQMFEMLGNLTFTSARSRYITCVRTEHLLTPGVQSVDLLRTLCLVLENYQRALQRGKAEGKENLDTLPEQLKTQVKPIKQSNSKLLDELYLLLESLG
jgi:hypothetical protein